MPALPVTNPIAIVRAASKQSNLPIACNPHALSAAERTRHAELLRQVRTALLERRLQATGVELRLDASRMTVAEAGEWFGLEHRCCPFLELALHLAPGEGPFEVTLSGPPGTRELLESVLAE